MRPVRWSEQTPDERDDGLAARMAWDRLGARIRAAALLAATVRLAKTSSAPLRVPINATASSPFSGDAA